MTLRWFLPAVVLLGLALGAQESRAQLLFSGGEDIDFTCVSGGSCVTLTGSSPMYRPAWARLAYGVYGNTNDPPNNRFASSSFTASATLWIHAQYCNNSSFIGDGCGADGSGNNTNAGAQLMRALDTAGNPTIVVMGTGVAGQLAISSRTAAGSFTTLATCSSAFNPSLTQLDLYINYSASGEVTLYNNSTKVCDYTGDVTNGDGSTSLDQVEFASPYNSLSAWSEIIVASSDTRAMARFTLNTTGDGNATGFTGTSICSSIWNSISFNDANYGYSGSSNVIHECTVNNVIPAGDFVVLGLIMSARALVGGSGPQHFDFVTRVGGTDYTSADYAPTTNFSNIQNYIQTVNPATSSAWAATDFQASGFNLGEETKP
jgi:hypothetical protein